MTLLLTAYFGLIWVMIQRMHALIDIKQWHHYGRVYDDDWEKARHQGESACLAVVRSERMFWKSRGW